MVIYGWLQKWACYLTYMYIGNIIFYGIQVSDKLKSESLMMQQIQLKIKMPLENYFKRKFLLWVFINIEMCQEKRQPKSFQSLSHILHVWPNEKLLKKIWSLLQLLSVILQSWLWQTKIRKKQTSKENFDFELRIKRQYYSWAPGSVYT